MAYSLYLPCGGHFDVIPVTYVVVGLEEILRPFFGVGHPMEFPCTVQSLIIGGFLDAQA